MARSLTGPGNIAKLGDTMLGPFNEAKAPDVPSASTVNLVITKGNLVDITGTTTILSMSLAPGAERVIRFTGSLRLTHSTTLVLPGAEDIITTPNDMAIVRGYPNGVVRFVTYSRASGYVQRVGDKLSGTLTFAAGNTVSPPIKYQAGVLTTLKVPHAFEWDGSKAYITTSGSVRKEFLYTDGDASNLTNLASKQVTDALGYTPFDPTSSPNTISPKGGLLEAGRYIDMHYGPTSANDYDVRFEASNPTGGSGTSILKVQASEIQVTGSKVWTASNLTNLNQLTNGPGYAPDKDPVFTGQVTMPQGGGSKPGIIFTGEEAADTGFYGPGDGVIGITCNARPVAKFDVDGVKFLANGADTAHILLQKNTGSTFTGDLKIEISGGNLKFYDDAGNSKGAYLDIMGSDNNAGSKIVTSTLMASLNQASGYQKMPNGMIFQWGKRSDGGVGHYPITFPIEFPNVCVGVYSCYNMSSGSRGDYRGAGISGKTGAYIPTDGCDTWWFAVGY